MAFPFGVSSQLLLLDIMVHDLVNNSTLSKRFKKSPAPALLD